jgi:hypothetical protein
MDTGEFFPDASYEFTAVEEGVFNMALGAVDGEGNEDPFPERVRIAVRGSNEPPSAWSDDPSTTLAINEECVFSASWDDPEGDPVTVSWDLGDGRIINGEEVAVSYDVPGTYRLSLTAVDSRGASMATPYQLWVFVNDYAVQVANSNPYPTMLSPAWGQTFEVNQTINFEAFGYDPDPDSVFSYYWDFNDGTLLKAESTTQKSFSVPGTYEVGVFVQDEQGFVSHYGAFTQIAVYSGSAPPDGVILSPELVPDQWGDSTYQVSPGSSLQLSATVAGVSDLTGYEAVWTVDGEAFAMGFNPGSVAVPEPGMYCVQLIVRDPAGVQDPIPREFQLWVRDYNTPPEIWIEEPGWDIPVEVLEPVCLSGAFYDAEEDEVSLSWIVSDGRQFNGERVDELRFDCPGLFWVDLEGIDSLGAVNTRQVRVYIVVLPEFDPETQQPPDLQRTSPSVESFVGPRDSQIQFMLSASDAFDEPIDAWRWDFGNGTTSSQKIPVPVVFNKPGTYLVRAFGRDASGLWSPYPLTWNVGIYGDNVPPDGVISTPPLLEYDDEWMARLCPAALGTTIQFSGSASDPDGNLPLEMTWFLNDNDLGSNPAPVTFQETGYFNLELHVKDAKGEEDPLPDYRVIHIVDPELKPVVYIGYPDTDLTVEPGEELWFYGYGEDPNDLDLSFQWDFGSGGLPSFAEGADVYPVVFSQETPDGQPNVVSLIARNNFAYSQPVSIRITVKQYEDEDFEPNDVPDQAVPLELGNYSRLSLGGSDQADYFSFQVSRESRNLKLHIDSGGQDGALRSNLYVKTDGELEPLDIHNYMDDTGFLILQDMMSGSYILELKVDAGFKTANDGIPYGLGVTTEQPVLYMPFLVEDGNITSEFGIVNMDSSQAVISIEGLDENGETVATESLVLGAQSQLLETAGSFFDKSKTSSLAKIIKWIRIHSATRLVGFFNARSVDGSQLMSAGAFKALSSSIVIPHVAQKSEQWYTRAIVVNGSEDALNLQFSDHDSEMRLGSLKSNGQDDFRFSDVFQTGLPGWGRFKPDSGKAALAGVEIFGRRDGYQISAALEMSPGKRENPNFTYVRNNIYFTHIAKDTVNFWTGLTLVNTENTPQTCRIIAYSDGGAVLTSMDLTLEASGKILSTVENLFPGVAGISWLEVEADRGIDGFVLFGDHQNTRLAGIPAANFLTDLLIFPYMAHSDTAWTGIAVLNIAQEDTLVHFQGFSKQGEILLEAEYLLPSKTKKVATIDALFPGQAIPPNLSYVTAHSGSKAINGFELFGSLEQGTLGKTMAGLSAQTQ